jgi:hypothetical protein
VPFGGAVPVLDKAFSAKRRNGSKYGWKWALPISAVR